MTGFAEVEGALSESWLRRLAAEGHLRSEVGIPERSFQPASLDLTLSTEAYKLPGSILPLRGESVRSLLAGFGARPIDLSRPCYLDRGRVYLIRLQEELDLPPNIGCYTNNKSSTGRIDLQTRTIGDANPRYEKHRRGYAGSLWLEVISKSFDVRVQAGVSLNQAIFYGERRILDDAELRRTMETTPLIYDRRGRPLGELDHIVDQGLMMSVDLDQDLVGWVAKRSPEAIVLDEPVVHDPGTFFDPVPRPRGGRLLLLKGCFYILSTAEYLRVPRDVAVEMLPFETTAGEFRAHYAGFFDPGFGWGAGGEIAGTPAVLEVRPYDDDLVLRHGQPICKMVYERLCEPAPVPYGQTGRNHYAHQRGPRLSKIFAV